MASLPVSPSLTRAPSATDSTGHLTSTETWTSEQEARLAYCQDQLKQAQKKWSDRQELWIREVEHLTDLKRAHKKALKKQAARAAKAFGKAKTWGPPSSSSRSQSRSDRPALVIDNDDNSNNNGNGETEGAEGAEEEAASESVALQPSPTQQSSNRNPFRKIIRRMSSARRGNSVREAEGSGV